MKIQVSSEENKRQNSNQLRKKRGDELFKKLAQAKKTTKKKQKQKQKQKSQKAVSELRQDVVTGDWVVIATGRAKRPEDYLDKEDHTKNKLEKQEAGCPFCGEGIKKQEPDTLIYYREDNEWSLRVIPNKYPAFKRSKTVKHFEDGIYFGMDGVGYHEVILTHDHNRGVPFLMKEEVAEVIDSFKTRYLELMNKKSVNYILFIENHGQKSGASLVHPHWQMFAIPVVSPQVKLELNGSKIYKKNYKTCVFCDMIEQERESKKRIVAENDSFIAFAPFASRSAFEVWVMPKKHQPYFERIKEHEEFEVAEIIKEVLEKYHWKLNDVSYNMYIHTAPCDGKDYNYYHWHIEFIPKTSIWAGFELGTGIEISTIEPEKAAQFLRKNI